MRLIDTHCHVDSPRYATAERSRVLAAAVAAGVEDIVVPGVHPDTWDALLDLTRASRPAGSNRTGPRLYPCAGIHPQVLPELDDRALAQALDRLRASAAGRVVAIGETGLDRPTTKQPGGALDRQIEALAVHLDVAAEAGLPVILHVFRCHDSMLGLLRRQRKLPPALILHSYSGGAALIPHYLELGGWFSYAGPVTYPNARRPVTALRATPRERLLLETDAPDQTPVPHRGALNEPAFLTAIAARAAEILEIPPSQVADLTTQNARRCYRLDTWRARLDHQGVDQEDES